MFQGQELRRWSHRRTWGEVGGSKEGELISRIVTPPLNEWGLRNLEFASLWNGSLVTR